MLHHKPRPLPVRVAREVYFFFQQQLIRLYWRVCKSTVDGAKVFIMHNNKLLVVRLGYDNKEWVLPGGKIDWDETPEQAAVREIKEEVGIVIDTPQFIRSVAYKSGRRTGEVHYFCITVDDTDITIDDQEIGDAGWFALDDLPTPTSWALGKEVEFFAAWLEKNKV